MLAASLDETNKKQTNTTKCHQSLEKTPCLTAVRQKLTEDTQYLSLDSTANTQAHKAQLIGKYKGPGRQPNPEERNNAAGITVCEFRLYWRPKSQ